MTCALSSVVMLGSAARNCSAGMAKIATRITAASIGRKFMISSPSVWHRSNWLARYLTPLRPVAPIVAPKNPNLEQDSAATCLERLHRVEANDLVPAQIQLNQLRQLVHPRWNHCQAIAA